MDITLVNVLEFHETFGQFSSYEVALTIPENVKKLRYNLMSEEYLELLKAENENNLVEVADALCDLKYVVNGTIIAHGLQNHWNLLYDSYLPVLDKMTFVPRIDDYLYNTEDRFINVILKLDHFIKLKVSEYGWDDLFADMFQDVHSSNMSKTCKNMEEVVATMEKYRGEGTNVDFFERGKYFIVYRVEDKKALKSVEYRPANLAQFL